MLDYSKSFIENQFPVSKISKESYKERKAGSSQTLTGLGKWWGRKPLILVRATLLGVLMPVSDNPVRDKEIFLKILTMDESGLWLRKTKSISTVCIFGLLNPVEKAKFFDISSLKEKQSYIKGISKDEKDYLQKLAFNRMSYDEKLTYCERPENVTLEDANNWAEINAHLETNALSLQDIIKQLGEKRFGHQPTVGDCFAGGGSIPFEAARMGADVYASDLNPVASLLTWASLNIIGSTPLELAEIKAFNEKTYNITDAQIIEWGIEVNEEGHRADSYLYCNESVCPECGYKVPLAPSWIIEKDSNICANLIDNGIDGFEIKICMNATRAEILKCENSSTIISGKIFCPHCQAQTPVSSLRGDGKSESGNTTYGLRKWKKDEFIARNTDIYKERLYAIRYIGDKGRYYVAPSAEDLVREDKVISLLSERFENWQTKGYIPSAKIEDGYNTNQPIRERGWQYWHQLFNPRQLLLFGTLYESIIKNAKTKKELVSGVLIINKLVDWGSKLSIWHAARPDPQNTFLNQALNTLYNYGVRGLLRYKNMIVLDLEPLKLLSQNEIDTLDARNNDSFSDIWITDPPYADAVNYHELAEFFLAWDKALLGKAFPEWYTDSKRVLAVKGIGKSFNDSMVEIYRNLANHMPDNGSQVVMFTHQDVKVWSEIAMILWSAGLRVVSAWNVATETESGGLKSGNYVKGTVLLTLKKQTSNEIAFQDELYDDIKREVQNIIDSMKAVDDKDDPDFTDADFLLASYASSLKVLTAFKEIEGIDVKYWLTQPRDSKEENPIEVLINKAVRIAYDYLIPEGFDKSYWKDLKPEERFYIRGLEFEINGSYKISSYQELARGFGVKDYMDMFFEFKANSARLKTPSEYRMTFLSGDGFESSLLRNLLVAIYETTNSSSTVEGRQYLKDAYKEDNAYWYKKPLMVEMLSFLSKIEFVSHMEHWHKNAYAAKLLKEALKNEGV